MSTCYFFYDSWGNKCTVQPDCVHQSHDGCWYDGHGNRCYPQLDGIVEGTAGNDLIDYNYTGDPDGDRIDHSDAVLGARGSNDDIVYAYGGNDTVLAGEANDTVYGGAGNDSLNGGKGNDNLSGDAGNDTLAGGAGCNVEYGGSGNDVFVGGAGADTFYGGTDQDNLDYSASCAGVTVNLTTGQMAGGDAGNDVIGGGIDGVIGSNFADSLTGFDQQGTSPGDIYTNQFYGNAGNDTIDAKGGADLVYGGNDNDLIHGGDGNDTVSGDAGNDTVYGDAGDDVVNGGIGDDRLYGGDGNDTVFGDEGNDTLYADKGADSLYGGDDRDLFVGGNACDFIDGNEGGNDYDTLDLTGAGPLHIVYDPNNPENGTVQFLDPVDHHVTGTLTFRNIENVIPCFTPGTRIATPKGEVPVESLKPGDRVITRDNGIQEIRWVGRKDLTYADLLVNPHLRPVLIRAGSLGNGLPERDMMVSPNHRLLVANDRTQIYFDEHEVLVAAKHLVTARGVQVVEAAATAYIHFMCDRHEVVLSDGAWSESFQPGDYTLKGMGNAQRNEIYELFPELKTDAGLAGYAAARRTLKKHEALLVAR